MRLLVVLVAGLAAGVLAAPAGSEPSARRTIEIGWNERASLGGSAFMTVRVKRLVIDGQQWRLVAGFTNQTTKTLRIEPRFALLIAPTRRSTGYIVRLAKRFAPPMPVTVFPGKGWSGTWHGQAAGALRPGRFLRVGFDRFVGPLIPGQPEFGLITDNVKKL